MHVLRKNKSWLLSAIFVVAGVILLLMGPSGGQNALGNPPPDYMCGETPFDPQTQGCCENWQGEKKVYDLATECCGCGDVYSGVCPQS